MGETTLFLAQITGPTLAILGLGMLLNKSFYRDLYKNVMEANLAYLTITIAMIISGIVIVSKHFLWGTFSEGLISFLGLAILFKGIAFALMPGAFNKLVKSILSAELVNFAGAIWLIGGVYLSYVGFFS